MNLPAITSALKTLVQLDNPLITIYDAFENLTLLQKGNAFAVINLKDVLISNNSSDMHGLNRYFNSEIICTISFFFSHDADYNSTISKIHSLTIPALLKSNLNISSAKGSELKNNSSLYRFQWDLDLTLNLITATINGHDLLSRRNNTAFAITDKLLFSVESFEINRTRLITETPTVCGAVIVNDGGNKPLTLKLIGQIFSHDADIIPTLDELISNSSPLTLSCLQLDLPTLILKQYSVKSTPVDGSFLCEMLLIGIAPNQTVTQTPILNPVPEIPSSTSQTDTTISPSTLCKGGNPI